MEELKMCPFCGGSPEVECGTSGARIRCSRCGISTDYCEDTVHFIQGGHGSIYRQEKVGDYGVSYAAQKWNNRVGDQP